MTNIYENYSNLVRSLARNQLPIFLDNLAMLFLSPHNVYRDERKISGLAQPHTAADPERQSMLR